MPTLTSAAAPFCPAIEPSTRLLLWLTIALAPIAVALVIPATPFPEVPTMVLLCSTVLKKPADAPIKILLLPVELLNPVARPKNEVFAPVVFARPDFDPKHELRCPAVLP